MIIITAVVKIHKSFYHYAQATYLRNVQEYEQKVTSLNTQLEEQTIVCEDLYERNTEMRLDGGFDYIAIFSYVGQDCAFRIFFQRNF